MRIYLKTNWSGRIDITERAMRWQFRSLLPGGWWDARVEITAPQRDLWELINSWPGGELIYHERGDDLWRGRLAGARLQGNALELRADGKARELLDEELWRVYADADYGDWSPVTDEDRAFATDNNNRVYVATNPGVIYAAGDEGRVTYPDNQQLGGDILRVQASAVVEIAIGEAWIAELRDDAGAVLWSASASTSEEIDVEVDSAAGLTLALRATAAVNTAPASGEEFDASYARLTQVVVRTLSSAQSSAIVEDIVDDAGIAAQIDSPGIEIDRAVYQGATALRALGDIAQLGDGSESWLFAIYNDVAEFRAWGTSANWMITPDDAASWSLAWQLRDVINAVRASQPDGWLSDWYVDEESVAHYGARRERTLRLPRTTRAEAARWAQTYLEDHARARAALRIATGALVRRADGSYYSAGHIRAGDIITLRDLIPDTDEEIRVQEVAVTAGSVTITPVGASSQLDVILAMRERER